MDVSLDAVIYPRERTLGAQYVVLNSDVVDAMAKHTDGVRFYVGHELGHLRMKHLQWHFRRYPVMWLPLLGAAYSRARESTCDRHGRPCCSSGDGAARAIAALSAGSQGWQQINVDAYQKQSRHSSGFWMSFHELTAGYPWLTKRAARVINRDAPLPSRNPLAYLPAAIVPYAGRLGGGFGLLILVYIVAVLAAIAVPAYQDYTIRAKLTPVIAGSQPAREALTRYFETNQKVPASLEQAGVAAQLPDGAPLALDPHKMLLTVTTKMGVLVFVPSTDPHGRIIWSCRNGEGLKPSQLPPACRKPLR
jgi:type II secretory pathway pseudopilin PulG